MKQIIFWFSNHRIRNYWLDYAIKYCKNKKVFKYAIYNKIESKIRIGDFEICFKVNNDEKDLIGKWNINQYWVEDLFDNNFEEFFLTFIKENFNGKKRN